MDFEVDEEGNAKRTLVLVLSPKAFHQTLHIASVSPISFIKSRHLFQIELPENVRTHGTVKLEQLLAVDHEARGVKLVEKVPAAFLSRCKTAAGRVLGF